MRWVNHGARGERGGQSTTLMRRFTTEHGKNTERYISSSVPSPFSVVILPIQSLSTSCRPPRAPWLTLLFLLIPLNVFSAGFAFAPEKTEVEAGAPIVIHGSATLEAGGTLALVDGQLDKESPFSVISLKPGQNGTLDLTIEAFALGEQTFPALDWKVTTADGKTSLLKSPPIKFKVTAPEAEKAGADIYDIMSPVRPKNILPYILLGLAILAGLFYWLWRRRPTEAERERAERRILSPHEEALERLARLLASGAWDAGRYKDFYTELGDLYRDYLERRYAMETRTLTTAGLVREMRQLEIDLNICGKTRQFLDDCDLVKFAKWTPATSDRDTDIERLKNLIEATKERSMVLTTENGKHGEGSQRP